MSPSAAKNYWKSLSRRDDRAISLPIAGDEFAEVPPPAERGVSRRDFLAAAGFTFGSVALTGCSRAPVEKAIPFLVQPEAIMPGYATHYASTCGACPAGCGTLVKNRDGRAIKLEGNPDHPVSRGGLCAVGQASVLGVYDNRRLRHPMQGNAQSTWADVDAKIAGQLAAVRNGGGAVRVLTGPITSPTMRRAIQEFLGTFADGKHVTFETFSSSAIAAAHERTHGQRVLPRYLIDKAEVVVGFDADFLGTWLSPVAFTTAWAQRRSADDASRAFSYHAQFESRLSVTGGKADRRVRVAPGEVGAVMSHLAAALAKRAAANFPSGEGMPSTVPASVLDDVADRLWHARGRSLVVCGSQDVDAQAVCNYINHLLGSYGVTVDVTSPARRHVPDDQGIQLLTDELTGGTVTALFIHGVNPVYELPNGEAFTAALGPCPLVVSLSDRLDETSKLATYVCPDHHFLESWGDFDHGDGTIGFRQPAMRPLFDTRSVLESLAVWSDSPKSAQAMVKETWASRIDWNQSIHDGFARVAAEPIRPTNFASDAIRAVAAEDVPSGGLALVLYPKVAMLDGRHAGNPWLHEMPDPITKVVWDNYASLSQAAARTLGVETGDVVRVSLDGENGTAGSVELPVLVQPGQHDQVVAIALGYGSEETARFADVGPEWLEKKPTLGDNGRVGVRASGLLTYREGTLRLSGAAVSVAPVGRRRDLASTQDYHNIEVPERLTVPGMDRRRPIIQETTLAAYRKTGELPSHGHHGHHDSPGELWPDDHKYEGHHWGMAIDLTACTGCSACVVACQVENNVPVVGRDEVRRKRIMHWMRIDRYYSESNGEVELSHQPMMCQHCDHAPCETVCPVLATVHGEEGLNQQAYNRCVGTRYCANNCPFKVRRFNWFEYARDDRLANMSLNPDITVRTQGVMEKCSFCVQRIEAARVEAKRAGRDIADGEVQPACQQSCPANAIVFGDMNDAESAVSKLIASGRHYRLLEETNVRPSVGYLGLVRNREEDEDQEHHG